MKIFFFFDYGEDLGLKNGSTVILLMGILTEFTNNTVLQAI